MTTEQRPNTPPPHPPADDPGKPRLDLSAAQVLGGALAAMTAAYLGSRLSVAGTVVGAAVASVVAAVAGSIYTASLKTTQQRVRTALQARVGAPGRGSRPGLPWRTVLTSALGAFLLAAVALTGLELATGTSLSGEQGTTVTQVTQVTEPRRPAPRDDASPTAEPSTSSPSSATPSADSPSPAAPPAAPTETPSVEAAPPADETSAPAPVPLPEPTEPEPSLSSPAPALPPSAPTEGPSAEGTG